MVLNPVLNENHCKAVDSHCLYTLRNVQLKFRNMHIASHYYQKLALILWLFEAKEDLLIFFAEKRLDIYFIDFRKLTISHFQYSAQIYFDSQ